ncbi:pentachlorophenol 4-monooxygenase [Coprinopsis sp. MPI-PUGE-AT-0042]|nr:pentachlorophenol 4-monooxygenase [Coprinopsis sp. MPI-PUGE-AT-0042]
MPRTPSPVLIVGGGPSGLVLGLILLQNGVPVRIIEKQYTARLGQRGAGIMPRSLELFSHLKIIDDVLERGIPIPLVRSYQMPDGVAVQKEFSMSPPLNPTPTNPFLNPLLLGQDRIEDIFHNALAKYGCVVEKGTELLSFEQHPNHVEVNLVKRGPEGTSSEPETCLYAWMVGTDGAKGVVRKQLGLKFVGETRAVENFVVGDIYSESLSSKYWHMWGDASDVLVSLRPTETPGLFNFMVAGKDINHAEIAASHDTVRQCLQHNVGKHQLGLGDIPWMSYYTPNIRMVETFGSDRVLIAGDAAHVHSPTGGQGVNTGIQDSLNLGWKLALVAKGYAQPALLDSYAKERIPVIAEMLQQTTKLLNQTFSDLEVSPYQREMGSSLLQLGVNYRWSPVVLDERKALEVQKAAADEDLYATYGYSAEDIARDCYGAESDGRLRAGDRAPDSSELLPPNPTGPFTVKPIRLFQLLSAAHHTALIFPTLVDPGLVLQELARYPGDLVKSVVILRHTASLSASVSSADYVLEDTHNYAHESYLADTCGLVIIRPDGIIGGILHDHLSVHRYFRPVLKP